MLFSVFLKNIHVHFYVQKQVKEENKCPGKIGKKETLALSQTYVYQIK